MSFTVIMVQETGEELGCFKGTEDQCYDWMNDNAERYEECRFYVEETMDKAYFQNRHRYYDDDYDYED
jgi:hypothetical protein